jgi:hypothetical protein
MLRVTRVSNATEKHDIEKWSRRTKFALLGGTDEFLVSVEFVKARFVRFRWL